MQDGVTLRFDAAMAPFYFGPFHAQCLCVQLSVNLLLVHDIFVHLDSYLFYLQTYKKSCVSIKKIILSWVKLSEKLSLGQNSLDKICHV